MGICVLHAQTQRGRLGVRTPLENHNAIRFLSNTGPDPLENHHKATNPPFMLEHYMAFRWWADDGPLLVVFGSSIPSSTKKKTLSILSWAPSDITFWICACAGSLSLSASGLFLVCDCGISWSVIPFTRAFTRW